VALGGEHTATYGIIKGLLAAGMSDVGVIQIDAHADLRDAYQNNKLSHGSVMRRIVDEDVPLFQLGARTLREEEIATRKLYGIKYIDAAVLMSKNVQKIELPDSFTDKVFM
jgi:agmatinase